MLRRALVITAFALTAVIGAAPAAQAIPPGPSLFVIAYYDSASKINVVGQAWSGCNQPSGSWGIVTVNRNYFFTPC